MIDERQAELASLYAVGALPPPEAKEFEAAMESNAELRQFTNQLRDASAAFALSAKSVAPPAALREKVLAAVNRPEKVVRLDFKEQKPRGWTVWLPWAMAACFAVCAGVLFQKIRVVSHELDNRREQADAQVRVINSVKNEKQMLEKQIEQARSQIAGIGQQLETQNRLLAIATNEVARLEQVRQFSEIRIAMLTAQAEASPKTIAVSLWDSKRQEGVFVGQDLAALPADKDYQLWVLDKDGKPYSAGVLAVDAQGHVHGTFKPTTTVATPDKFAVTVERKGGENAPTTKPILVGSWL